LAFIFSNATTSKGNMPVQENIQSETTQVHATAATEDTSGIMDSSSDIV
jgi:hypothetical protein